MKGAGWVATHEDITDRERADAMLAANAAEVRRINERFDVAISNMSQGLCLFDADRNLVISNRRYQEMYNLPDRLVTPGTPLQKILQHYYDRGERGEAQRRRICGKRWRTSRDRPGTLNVRLRYMQNSARAADGRRLGRHR